MTIAYFCQNQCPRSSRTSRPSFSSAYHSNLSRTHHKFIQISIKFKNKVRLKYRKRKRREITNWIERGSSLFRKTRWATRSWILSFRWVRKTLKNTATATIDRESKRGWWRAPSCLTTSTPSKPSGSTRISKRLENWLEEGHKWWFRFTKI